MQRTETPRRTSPERRFLVVDDEPTTATAIARFLADWGEATAVSTVKQAREQLQSGRWDLVFLDVAMPGASGFELLEEFRKRDEVTPVTMLTGLHEPELISRAGALGAHYMCKAGPIADLRGFVERVLSNRIPSSIPPAPLRDVAMGRGLTEREAEIAVLYDERLNRREVAERLGVSEETVKKHVASILEKLACDSMRVVSRTLRDVVGA